MARNVLTMLASKMCWPRTVRVAVQPKTRVSRPYVPKSTIVPMVPTTANFKNCRMVCSYLPTIFVYDVLNRPPLRVGIGGEKNRNFIALGRFVERHTGEKDIVG